MVRVSASSLRDYLTCKRKVYYRISKAARVKTASLITGSLIHQLIEDYETKRNVDLAVYKNKLTRELSAPGMVFYRGQTIPKLVDLIDVCFSNYLGLTDSLPSIVDSEKFFSFVYRDGVEVVGRFDQVREGNILVDFKTGRAEPNEYFLAADLQATFYSWAYREMFHTLPTYYYIHLRSGTVYELHRDKFGDLLSSVEEYIYDLENKGRLIRECDGYKCSRCEYKEICLDPHSKAAFEIKQLRKKPTNKSNFLNF